MSVPLVNTVILQSIRLASAATARFSTAPDRVDCPSADHSPEALDAEVGLHNAPAELRDDAYISAAHAAVSVAGGSRVSSEVTSDRSRLADVAKVGQCPPLTLFTRSGPLPQPEKVSTQPPITTRDDTGTTPQLVCRPATSPDCFAGCGSQNRVLRQQTVVIWHSGADSAKCPRAHTSACCSTTPSNLRCMQCTPLLIVAVTLLLSTATDIHLRELMLVCMVCRLSHGLHSWRPS